MNISNFAFVVDINFHRQNRWVSAFAPCFVNAVLDTFNPIIISSQREYDVSKKDINFILSMEPGWASPMIKYDKKSDHTIAVLISDPHKNKKWFPKYVRKNRISYALSQYKSPFFYHMPKFPKHQFVHFPWAVPDEFIHADNIKTRSDDVVIFGAGGGDAYDVRNWCRMHPLVQSYEFSGVENKKMTDEAYYQWLTGFDAIIAAGSSNPRYDLVTPKYFEIAASGALLIGQYCHDLEGLGFNQSNCVIFTKDDFDHQVRAFKNNPGQFLEIRKNGRELIRLRHKISDRIQLVHELAQY